MEKIPEITGDIWFNSKRLSPADLKGKVVLVDFWTYSCVNCLRTLPYLKDWWKKYKDRGLVIIGVHAPEFEFEKDKGNVERAVRKLGVTWPVVLDNDMVNWNNFNNRFWPAKYMTDKEGNIVYTHFGEGSYKETEKAIQELLKDDGMPEIKGDEHSHGKVCLPATPELYCGYKRGVLGNAEGYRQDTEAEYTEPEEIAQNTIALSGAFLTTSEYVESRKDGAELLLRFQATEVNLVMHSVEKEAVVEILFDSQPLPKELWGSDVVNGGEVSVKEPRMYNLLKAKKFTEGVLRIRAKKGIFRAFAFTFSGCGE